MTWKTYEVQRPSADVLIVIAHPWYFAVVVSACCLLLAIYLSYRARMSGSKSSFGLFLILFTIGFGVMSIPHGRMVFNKATNTFTADRTHMYLATDHTEAKLSDVDHASLNQANTTYQLQVILRNSDKPVVIYGLDSAVGQDDAARAIDKFLIEYLKENGARDPDAPEAYDGS